MSQNMVHPGATIGILGGGQLGRFIATAAADLGYRTAVWSDRDDDPALQVCSEAHVASYFDIEMASRFAKACDVVTYEFENIPAFPLATVVSDTALHPSAEILEISQNRRKEKTFLSQNDFPVTHFEIVTSAEELEAAVQKLGTPAILKTASEGYDGKGQVKIEESTRLHKVWESLDTEEAVLEAFVPFDKELSVIVARSSTREISCFPAVENVHKNHILDRTIAPAEVDSKVVVAARDLAERLAETLDLVGLLAVELFLTKDGALLINELAPRPHNSGHWTLDGCVTSQFEQLVRAICGLPLGSVDVLAPTVMENLLGNDIHKMPELLQDPANRVYVYGKSDPRPGRKMGHVNRLRLPAAGS